jgi:histidine triad (HIT) family protein
VKKDFVADCLFCRISAGEVPSKIVYQDEDVLAFHDIQPQAKYHVLIIPRRHVANSLNDFGPEDDQVMLKILSTARNIARELGIDQSGYRVVANTGRDAGQSVFHIHFHLLGGAPLGLFGISSQYTRNAE